MRYTQLLIPTVKEVPAEAEIPSHQLMIRAGFIRKLASGTYTYLPLGWRSLRKIMQIIRQEMDAAGAQEISMPILQPLELWQQTGRDVDYGPTMCRFVDQNGRENVLAPTAEEVVTSLVAAEVSSYRQLPLNLYQINTKFRDEIRPRFGVLRSREFLMKDAYSFDADLAGLEATYRKMYDAYCRIFDRCGLKYVVVEAESGPIGGSASHEFMVLCATGEDVVVHTEDFSYAANIERAEVDAPSSTGVSPVSAATGNRQWLSHPCSGQATGAASIPAMQEVHTPKVGSIEAVCRFLGATPQQMIKTLLYLGDEKVVVGLIRGDHEANEGKLTRAAGVSHLALADEKTIVSTTGAAVGFAGPMGLAGKVGMLVIDPAVAAMTSGVTGANKTDYHVRNVVPGRDFPLGRTAVSPVQDNTRRAEAPAAESANVVVADIRNAVEGDTHSGQPLKFSHGIEVGHVFKLGAKYSAKLNAVFADPGGVDRPCVMGCYGIGVNRILAAAIEIGHDDNGCILPASIAPFEVEVLPINVASAEVMAEAERIHDELAAAGVDVLMDDRDARPGVKFKDADLIGSPLRITVGERGLKEGKVELKRRTDAKPTLVPLADAAVEARNVLAEMRRG